MGKDALENNLLSSSPDPQDPIGWSCRQGQFSSQCSIMAKPDGASEPWAAMRESRKKNWEKAGKGQLPVRHMHPTLLHSPPPILPPATMQTPLETCHFNSRGRAYAIFIRLAIMPLPM